MAWEHACGLIRSAHQGTGYLISPTSMITCQHVVGNDTEVTVCLRGQDVTGKIERADRDLDLALIRFPEPIAGIEPLQFAAACPSETRWKTYGYPALVKAPIPMLGYVVQADGIDSLGQASLVLYADMVRGEGQTISGLSGSPVVVNGRVVGNIKRIVENPDRKGWPLYGLLWATPSAEILGFLRETAAVKAEPEPVAVDPLAGVRHEFESIISPTGVYGLWNSLQETGVLDEELSVQAAKLLVSKGRPELALEIVNSLGNTVPVRRLQARVVGEMNQLEESIGLFEQLQREDNLDADSGGVLAGAYRRLWLQSGEIAWRGKSYQTYRRYWEGSGDTYCGVNAAAMALQEGKKAESCRIAAQVLGRIEEKPIKERDHWHLATRAEALLLLGDMEGAREAYGEAKAAAAGKDHDIAVMWRGAVSDLKKLGESPALFDDLLRPRRAAAFFGHSVDAPGRQPPRFPATGVKDVRQAIAAKIRQEGIGFGVCSACRGSDLLFLDELLKQQGRARVVLTNPREEFARTFVGPTWRPIFDDIMSSGKVEVRVLEPATDTWLEVRTVVRAELKRHASVLASDCLLITVWNGEPGYVEDSVHLWEASGDPVENIPVGTARGAVA